MTRRRIRKNSDHADVNMTPMLDIVFIMLIFFIVTAVFFDENGIDMSQPQGNPLLGPSRPINVYLYADGSAAINGVRTDINTIPAHVQAFRAEAPQAVVVLGADKSAPHGNVVLLKDRLDRDNIPVNLKVRTQ